jgi:hypothetical protein
MFTVLHAIRITITGVALVPVLILEASVSMYQRFRKLLKEGR